MSDEREADVDRPRIPPEDMTIIDVGQFGKVVVRDVDVLFDNCHYLRVHDAMNETIAGILLGPEARAAVIRALGGRPPGADDGAGGRM